MPQYDQEKIRHISWNGVCIGVPTPWEVKAVATHHLHVEHNFKPVIEMRWQKIEQKLVEKSRQSALKQFSQTGGIQLHPTTLAKRYRSKLGAFQISCYTATPDGEPQFLFLHDPKHGLFLMIQIFLNYSDSHPLDQIDTIECTGKNETQWWAIQDFRFSIPSAYTLQNHIMEAGITSLKFKHKKTTLHLCRLAPAAVRLQKASLDEILFSLLGFEKHLPIERMTDSHLLFERNPSVLQQIFYRLRRKSPFIRSRIWHDVEKDRLLGVFMEAIHPIELKLHDKICSSYEISATK